MQHIIIDNSDFNSILSSHKKIDINQFVSWYESLSPEYQFIKDKKKTFQKNSKNLYTAIGLKSITLGDTILWEKVFFLNHFQFLPAFTQVLQNKNFNYWQEYLNYIINLNNLPISNAYDIICYAIENSEFLNSNKNEIINLLEKTLVLLEKDNNSNYLEKYLNIFEFTIANNIFDIEWLLIKLSSILELIPKEQTAYHLKNIFSSHNTLDLNIELTNIHPLIIPYLTKQKSYKETIGTGFHVSIDTLLLSISPSYSQNLSQTQIIYQLNILNDFIKTIQKEQKLFWFIDSHFDSNNKFTLNAFPKDTHALNYLKNILEISLHEHNEEPNFSILLNNMYLETTTPISNTNKKQDINKF